MSSDLEKNVTVNVSYIDPPSRPSLTIRPQPMAPTDAATGRTDRSHSVSSDSAADKDSLKKGGLISMSENITATQTVVAVVPASYQCSNEVEELKIRRSRDASTEHRRPGKLGNVFLPLFAAVTLAWWVSGLVVKETKHEWIPRSIWAWFFLLVTLFRYIPASIISKPIGAVWSAAIANPFSNFSSRAKLGMLWACALAITFATAFGSARPSGTAITDRVISLAGIYFCQLIIVGMSHNKDAINWFSIPRSIILQQALALFILRADAGIKFFTWINSAVSDFQSSAIAATALIFDADTTGKAWFFVTGLATMIFLTSWVQMLYFFNWMQWFTKQFAFLGYHVLSASGAETFVALWTPWFGQVHSAILVNPYVDIMTNSEIASIMATSMSSISSLMILSYATKLAIPLRALIAISGISIPGAIINAKIAFPEATVDENNVLIEPLTKTRESTCANRKKINLRKAVDLLDCLSDGALLGLKVAGWVLTNFFCILSLLVVVDGLLIYVFRSFGVHDLDLHLVIAAPLAPLTFFLGVPRNEVWRTAYILSGKLLVNSDFAMAALNAAAAGIKGAGPGSGVLSERAYNVMVGALANTANLGALGIQVGVMVALAPNKKSVICKAGIPALLVATVSSIQAACIAASLF
ncbi:hypothetical protein Clacol_007929 [Clathrus columnatus]|uniref:Solute carrier family 28 member 3 n=1 Tax=Clathrus columnatus TaxID=1419009 RepID=A0AAV5AKQ9_9AGAM|nr:hypothetical protein Clacol_007929 [Clathrus columnatus]